MRSTRRPTSAGRCRAPTTPAAWRRNEARPGVSPATSQLPGASARSSAAAARSEEALSAATCIHSSSMAAESSRSWAWRAAGASSPPSVHRSWKRTRGSGSLVMASRRVTRAGSGRNGSERRMAFSRTPASASPSARPTVAASSWPRPSSVQSACSRPTAEELSRKRRRSNAGASGGRSSTISRCAVRRHQMFGSASIATRSAVVASPGQRAGAAGGPCASAMIR